MLEDWGAKDVFEQLTRQVSEFFALRVRNNPSYTTLLLSGHKCRHFDCLLWLAHCSNSTYLWRRGRTIGGTCAIVAYDWLSDGREKWCCATFRHFRNRTWIKELLKNRQYFTKITYQNLFSELFLMGRRVSRLSVCSDHLQNLYSHIPWELENIENKFMQIHTT